MIVESGADRSVVDMKYDDKVNPYMNYFDLYTFYNESLIEVESSFSKNNIVEARNTYTYEDESDTEILKFTYSYDGKFPTVQRCTYTEQYYDYWEDEYYTETYTESVFFEYE